MKLCALSSSVAILLAVAPIGPAQEPALLPDGVVKLSAEAERSTLDRVRGLLTSTVEIKAVNQGTQPIDGPLHALVKFRDPGGREVRAGILVPGTLGGFGVTPWQVPFFDLSSKVPVGGWRPGQDLTWTLTFTRARSLVVTYEISVAARLNHPPVADAGGPYTGRAGEPVSFAGAASDPDGDPLTFEWDFGGGATATASGASHSYTDAGVYEATFRVSDGRGAPVEREVNVSIVPDGNFALAHTRVVTGSGHPVGGVGVTEEGPAGERDVVVEESGFVSLGTVAGDYLWKFSLPGHRPVWRRARLEAGEVRLLPSPWLAAEEAPMPIGVLDDTGLGAGDGSVRVTFPAGAFSQPGDARLTRLGAQTLPLPLPFGWSPLASFHLDLPETAGTPGDARLRLAEAVAAGEFLTLARFDATARKWVIVAVIAGEDTAEVRFPISDGGTFAALVRDEGTGAPVPAGPGDDLPGGAPQELRAAVTATGAVTPPERPASVDAGAVTAEGAAVITGNAGALPSGSWFRLGVQETYDLADGTGLRTPDYDASVYAYRRPGPGGTTVRAAFPLRPRLLFGPSDLKQAQVHVDVLTPLGDGAAALSTQGGALSADGMTISIPANALGGFAAGSLRSLAPSGFSGLSGPGQEIIRAFELNLSGLAPGTALGFALTGPVTANTDFLLTRLVGYPGGSGLAPVQRFHTNGVGQLSSTEPGTPPRLPGLSEPGQYLLVKLAAPQGLIAGVVRTRGGGFASGIATRVTNQPWLSVTGADGRYFLTAPAGDTTLFAGDSGSGDGASADVTLAAALVAVIQDLTLGAVGPRITSTNPADGAEKVSAVTPVTVTFSERLAPASLGTAPLTLRAAGAGADVAGGFTLDLSNRMLTFLPIAPLDAAAVHTLTVSPGIRDLQNLPLDGPREFTFTTAAAAVRGDGAQLTIYEPGGAGPTPADQALIDAIPGYTPGGDKTKVVAIGSAGSADPEVPVILVNESTGGTATVLSKADGSFASCIEAAEEDFITAVFINGNGTRVSIPAGRQKFDDGRTGLFRGGGILEAESDGGEVQVTVEPEAVASRTVFRVEPVPLPQVLQALGGVQPLGGKVLGGVRYEEGVDPVRTSVDLSFPLNAADLPAGADPFQSTFALTVPLSVDGQVVYQVIDAMEVETGVGGQLKLVTKSPPFVGLLLRQIEAMRQSAEAAGVRVRGVLPVTPGGFSMQSVLGVAFAPIFMAPVPRIKTAGKVVSLEEGVAVAEIANGRPVAGAFVRYQSANQIASRTLAPGEVVAVSEADGRYALTGPSLGLDAVIATHPRFSLQVASTRLSAVAGGAAVTRIDLAFSRQSGAIDGVADTAPPEVRVAQSPRFPNTGLNEADGATIEVTAIDDFRVAAITVIARSFATLGTGAPLDLSLLGGPHLVDEISGEASRMQRRFKVRAAQAGRAVYDVIAVDGSGAQTRVTHAVSFGAQGVIPPGEIPLRVLAVWPPSDLAVGEPADLDAGDADPPPRGVTAGTPIVLRFNQPLPDPIRADPAALNIHLEPADSFRITSLEPSADGRELTVHWLPGATAAGRLTLTIDVGSVEQFTESGGETEGFNYAIDVIPSFSPVAVAGATPLNNSRGTAIAGNFVYQTGSRDGVGWVQHFEFTRTDQAADPALTFRSETSFDAQPTALVHVPKVALRREDGSVVAPFNYLGVFEGLVGDAKGLRLFRVGPEGTPQPMFERAGFLTTEPAQVVNAKWDAPFIAYLELGADTTSVNLLNLNAYFVGQEARAAGRSMAAFPERGQDGVDLNRDGDFADAGERAPLPAGAAGTGLGVEFSWAPTQSNDRIADFDLSADFGLVCAAVKGINGRPHALVVPLGGVQGRLDDESARAVLPDEPKRVILLVRQKFVRAGAETEGDLAVVGTFASAAQTAKLHVVDISNPSHPSLVGTAVLPEGTGSVNVIERDAGGLLSVSTALGGVLKLDPRLLLVPGRDGVTAALRTAAPGVGGTPRTFVSDPSGWVTNASAGAPTAVFTEPTLSVVTFSGVAPFDPQALTDAAPRPPGIEPGEQGVTDLLDRARVAGTPRITSFLSDVSVSDPEANLYVVLRSPGLAGATLELAAAAVDSTGRPLLPDDTVTAPTCLGAERLTAEFAALAALNFVKLLPSRPDLSEFARNIAQRAGSMALREIYERFLLGRVRYDKTDLMAHRMSNDPTCPLFNTYLAGPIVLLKRDPHEGDETIRFNASQGIASRRYLRAATYLWAGLGVSLDGDSLLGRHASLQDDELELSLNITLTDALSCGIAVIQLLITENPLPLIKCIAKVIDGELIRVVKPGLNARVDVGCIRHPLVFIPGVMGSRLRGGPFLDLWLNPLNRFFDSNLEELVLKADGSGLTGGAVEAHEVMDKLVVGAGPLSTKVADAGDELVQSIAANGYRVYELNGEKSLFLPGDGFGPQAGEPNRESLKNFPNLFPYPFDWRQDNAASARRLYKYVNLIRAFHPDGDRIDIVAHSMGGLVSRRLILDHPGVVDRLITIASPLLGATKAVAAKRLGDFDDMALNLVVPTPVMKRIARHNPALDQLMPCEGLFRLGFRPVAETGWDADGDGRVAEVYEYTDYRKVLDTFLYRSQPGDFPETLAPDPQPIDGNNQPFFFNGSGSNTQQDWSGDFSDTRYFHIVALQRLPRTISRLRLTPSLTSIDPAEAADVGLALPPLDFVDSEQDIETPIVGGTDPQFPSTVDHLRLNLAMLIDRGPGDSTVPFLSQTRGYGSEIDLNARNAVLIPVLSQAATGDADKASSHVGVLSDGRCKQWVRRILADEVTRLTQPMLSITASGAVEGSDVAFSAEVTDTPDSVGARAALGQNDFIWDTGDAGMYIGRTGGRNIYGDDGTFTLTCAAATRDGRFGVVGSRTLHITNAPPVPRFTDSVTEAVVSSPVTFRVVPDDPGRLDQHTYRWDFGDGTTADDGPPDLFTVRHAYARPGSFTVTVVVRDDDGAEGTVTKTVTVGVGGPAPLPPAQALAPLDDVPGGAFDGPAAADLISVTVTGHTAAPGDLSIRQDSETLFDLPSLPNPADLILSSLKTLVLAQGQSSEQITIFRVGDAPSDPEPEESSLSVKAAGTEVTLKALVKYQDGRTFCFVWTVPTDDGDEVTLTVPWARLRNPITAAELGTLVTPAPNRAAAVNCLDLLGPVLDPTLDRNQQVFTVHRPDQTVIDGDPVTEDLDPTEEDRSDDGDTTQTDTFYGEIGGLDECEGLENAIVTRLSGGKLPASALSSFRQVVTVRDAEGNPAVVSERPPRVAVEASTPADLEAIRVEIRGIFNEALDRTGGGAPPSPDPVQDDFSLNVPLVASPTVRDFLLNLDDLWVFEQGSGACLWKGDDARCLDVFQPGRSDNDFELFLPVWKGFHRQLDPDDAETRRVFALHAHTTEMMSGDYYFKAPRGLVLKPDGSAFDLGPPPPFSDVAAYQSYRAAVTHWLYVTAASDSNPPEFGIPPFPVLRFPTLGGKIRFTVRKTATGPFAEANSPAMAMAALLSDLARNSEARKKRLPDISFFPYRREHFLFARPSLELPPPFGSDIVGDAGMGRSLLLLKWLVEGEFVTPMPIGGENRNLNQSVPNSLDLKNAIHVRLRENQDLLRMDGFEWALLQDFALMRSNAQLRMEPRGAAGVAARNRCRNLFGDFITRHDELVIQRVGKAAIRGVLAALTSDQGFLNDLLQRTPGSLAADPPLSFEHLIRDVALAHLPALPGNLTTDDLNRFLDAKGGRNRPLIDSLLDEPTGVDGFIHQGFAFLEAAQQATLDDYTGNLELLNFTGRVQESIVRLRNGLGIENGFPLLTGTRESGRLSMYGVTGEPEHDARFRFYVGLHNTGNTSTDAVTLTMRSDDVETGRISTTVPPHPAYVRLWEQESPPRFVARHPVQLRDRPIAHTLTLSGLPAGQNRREFNDRSEFASYLLDLDPFDSGAFREQRGFRWRFRGLSVDAAGEGALLAQLAQNHLPSTFRRAHPNATSAEINAARDASLQFLAAEVARTGGLIGLEPDQIAPLTADEKIAIAHVHQIQDIAISTSVSFLAARKFSIDFLDPAVNSFIVAMRIPDSRRGTYYLNLQNLNGNSQVARRLNPDLDEEVFLDDLQFAEAILLRVILEGPLGAQTVRFERVNI